MYKCFIPYSYSFCIISVSAWSLSLALQWRDFIHFHINSPSYKALKSHCSNSYLVSGSFSFRGKVCISLSVTAWPQLLHPSPMLWSDTADQLKCRSPSRSQHYSKVSHMSCAQKKSASCACSGEKPGGVWQYLSSHSQMDMFCFSPSLFPSHIFLKV